MNSLLQWCRTVSQEPAASYHIYILFKPQQQFLISPSTSRRRCFPRWQPLAGQKPRSSFWTGHMSWPAGSDPPAHTPDALPATTWNWSQTLYRWMAPGIVGEWWHERKNILVKVIATGFVERSLINYMGSTTCHTSFVIWSSTITAFPTAPTRLIVNIAAVAAANKVHWTVPKNLFRKPETQAHLEKTHYICFVLPLHTNTFYIKWKRYLTNIQYKECNKPHDHIHTERRTWTWLWPSPRWERGHQSRYRG